MRSDVQARYRRIAQVGFAIDAQERVRVERCNLCSGRSFVQITHSDRYGFPVAASACTACGLVFLNPVMTPSAYARFYEVFYRPLVSAFHGRVIDARTVQHLEQKPYAARLTTTMEPFIKSTYDDLLDIGGSTGLIAEHLSKRFRLQATVLDPAPAELAEAHRRGLKTMAGFIENLDAAELSFDVILMCQTVDHLLDIRSALEKVRATISPDGIFFVDIVDFRAAYLRAGSVEAGTKVDHPYYLTESTFELYLASTGFEVIFKNYAEDHLHVGYICIPSTSRQVDPDKNDVADFFREIRAVQNKGSR